MKLDISLWIIRQVDRQRLLFLQHQQVSVGDDVCGPSFSDTGKGLFHPKILLLDEVTANLDPESEYRVEQTLARLRKGRITFVIAHRTSAVKDVDEIILLNSRSFNTPVPERSL